MVLRHHVPIDVFVAVWNAMVSLISLPQHGHVKVVYTDISLLLKLNFFFQFLFLFVLNFDCFSSSVIAETVLFQTSRMSRADSIVVDMCMYITGCK